MSVTTTTAPDQSLEQNPPTGSQPVLKATLKQRHTTMIALGGVIGAGLFVGSSAHIARGGPATVLSYLAAGIVVMMIMRMLGEMAVAYPTSGSFSEYARKSLGDWAGFAVGWMYWWEWVIAIAVEVTAGAAIMHSWLPAVPLWAFSLGLMVVLTLTNLISVRSYGEFEFWFASIKVIAILVFVGAGISFVCGLWPHHPLDFSNLTSHHGFMPNGISAVLSGIAIVIFSFFGGEIATIAAAESADPRRAVSHATRSVVGRVLVFFVLSILLIVTILPWNRIEVGKSPFASALAFMGIPGAAEVMTVVVLTAVLSALNSGIYATSRMLFSLARREHALRGLTKVSRRGVPVKAVLAGTVVGYISVIMSFVSPTMVFPFLINSAAVLALFVYLFIALTQLKMRARLEREEPHRLTLPMWGYPYTTWISIVLIVGVIVSMAFVPTLRSQLLVSLISVAIILMTYAFKVRKRPQHDTINPVPVSIEQTPS